MTPALYLLSFLVLSPVDIELPTLEELSTECAPEVELRRKTLMVDGQLGIWFAEPVAACMAGRLRAIPPLLSLVELYEARIKEEDERVAALRRQLELSYAIEERLTASLDHAMRAKREAEESRDKISRRPALWFALGVVTTGALMFATTVVRR